MAEKIASGVIMESPAYGDGDRKAPDDHDEAVQAARMKRDGARGTVVLGVGMMFLGTSFGAGFAVGGALMTIGGTALAIYWGMRLRRLQGDPWHDEELDAWEEEHFR